MAGNCVRVEPPFINFNDVRVGQVYKTTVTATNVGKTSKKIVIEKPTLKSFRFTATSPSMVVVAPGLSVSGLLEFTPDEEEVVRDCLLVNIGDLESIEVPLRGFPRACSLLMNPLLDFGCIAANSQIICKQHPITNRGSAPGMFQVHYAGDPSVRLSPCSGVIAAGATQWLKVELCTDRPRLINEKAQVNLQNRFAVALSIKAEVVDQQLEVYDMQGTPLSCLWFGPVYFGTSRVEHVVLRNAAPEACDWVCLLQEAAAGTEVGTDLHKSTDAALLEGIRCCSRPSQEVSELLACFPQQGRLGPYEETTVAVRFSPICKSAATKKRRDSSPGRQDYCLFLLFESVGARHGFTHHSGSSCVELAVAGSGLPVSLLANPQRFDFLTCVTGQRVDLLCVLQNLCPQLPVNFHFRKVAHFSARPNAGTIAPGQSQDVVLSFTARQQGSFRVRQRLDVMGRVVCQKSENTDATELELRSFHTITLHLSAVALSQTTHTVPKLNSGLTPTVTNPTGCQPHVRTSELARCHAMARAAVVSSNKTRLHIHRREKSQETKGEEFLAFPNDRAASIRPASSRRQYRYRTIFTGIPRYSYVDTCYALSENEKEQKEQNRQIYKDFIQLLRQTRLSSIKERRQRDQTEQEVDIGIVPAQGLVPPQLHVESRKSSETKSDYNAPSSGMKHCCFDDKTAITRQVSEVMNAVPSGSQQVADCSRTLTPQELYQVVIGPVFVDFGEVCVQSRCVQKLELINHLSVCVWVQLDVDCPEMQGSSPLSHVLPPDSHSTLPLTFQSSKLGRFYRPVSYSVNQQHCGQILVQAQVVPLALELSTTLLLLHPTPNLLAQSGYRSAVTLRNRYNRAAEFTWRPVVTENGILFSIRPATGVVEPYRELDCEVVWHPSFSSPAEGDFDFCVHEGNTQRLHCVAKLGSTRVQLAEKQLMFGPVPLNMPSVRNAVLHNTGQNHAYYQVLDVCPLPGLVLSPSEGVVPSGGQAVIKIHLSPDSVIKFDTRVKIALRDMASVELRVGGSVEPPDIDINVSHFQFHGVYAGSRRAIPFTLTNRLSAAAQVAFDLSQYADFSLQLPQPAAKKEPGVSVMEVQAGQTVDCSLIFTPTQGATYDFDLPLTVNGVRWPTAASSPSLLPPLSSSSSSTLSASSWKHMVKPLSLSASMETQRSRHVQATVLCAPLEMSPTSLQFDVNPLAPQLDVYTKTVEVRTVCGESLCWRGLTRQLLHWRVEDRGEGEICTVTPSCGSLGPSQSVCLAVSIRPEALTAASGRIIRLSLPLYLEDEGGEGEHLPYRELVITVTLQLPRITIRPPLLCLTPVPLRRNVTATLTLLAAGYTSGTKVSAEVEEVELEDGTKMQPVSISFPGGSFIPVQNQNQDQVQTHPVNSHSQEDNVTSLTCTVTFCSAMPLSVCTTITFTDHLHNRFKVKLCAVADNSLLTVWPYLALHRSEQQIVLKTGGTAVEAILQRCHTPSPASCTASTSTTSTTFDHVSSTNQNSLSGSYGVSGETSRDDSEVSPDRWTLDSLGIPEFPAATSDEGLYQQSVVVAVERWFSLFGWPSGPRPVSVPHTLRRVVCKIQTNPCGGRTYRVSQNKDHRSVVDMLHHLSGSRIPGIPRCQTFSTDKDQCTRQLLQQHEAMLAFLRAQGAALHHIRPEYLLDVQEFKHWCSQQSNDEGCRDYSGAEYESLSKRSWTDVLLQIYKVLVLVRVSVSCLNQEVDKALPNTSRPLVSNVYSACELRLLSWLNKHYEDKRTTTWDDVPSARWIVNFDLDMTDGLVLAALLASYCPYLISSHLWRMYTAASSLEQILHNNIILVQSLNLLSLNIDIQPTDLSDPNPVQMLMLCVHLYERLPQYLPQETITLSGSLHASITKLVRLKNPSAKAVKYQALLLGEQAHLFSFPGGSTVTIPPKASAELSVQHSCSFLQPKEAFLLLISSSPSGLCGVPLLVFSLKTCVSNITPTKTVKCRCPCYQQRVIQVPVTNPFNKEAQFRVVLVESAFNPLEPEKKKDRLVLEASSKAHVEKTTPDGSGGQDAEGQQSALKDEFLSSVRSVHLKPGQADILNIHHLPFCPGTKYCSVLLVCPQAGDLVYLVKATAELPLPSPLTARPSSNIVSDPAACEPVLSLSCKVQQVCEEVMRVPLINTAWERALAMWGQHSMSADEHTRRILTHTLCSSTVRATTAICKLFKQQLMTGADSIEELTYSVEVSLPQYFTLPSTVRIPIKEDTAMPWGDPADCGCVDVPFRFQADCVGLFSCQVVLKSSCDTRVYMLEAAVTSQEQTAHLDFSSPAHSSVTQDIPVHNESHKDWTVQAEVCGEGFSGPKFLSVPAGTKACYPLCFHPTTAQSVVMGRLSLHNQCNGSEHVFTLRGVGQQQQQRPLPVEHLVLHCPVGETTHTQLHVPNYSQNKVTLKVVTDLSVVSGTPSLEIELGQSAPYTVAVSPWKRGKLTGCVSFVETGDEADEDAGRYEVNFSVEVFCEPTAPVQVIDVKCAAQSTAAVEIVVKNPRGELLMLDVQLQGDDLSGDECVSVPPHGARTYTAVYSPVRAGTSTGSVVFQSELVGEFWYQLELHARPPWSAQMENML